MCITFMRNNLKQYLSIKLKPLQPSISKFRKILGCSLYVIDASDSDVWTLDHITNGKWVPIPSAIL